MISEEYRRLGVIADAMDAIEFSFTCLKERTRDALKGLHVRTREDIRILEKNLERSIKLAHAITFKLLSEADELKAEQDRTKKLKELKGAMSALETLSGALDQQRKVYLEEIDAIEEKMRKRRSKKRSTPAKRRA